MLYMQLTIFSLRRDSDLPSVPQFQRNETETKGGDRVGQSYLMQGGETVFIAEVWTHIVLQQVAYWWKDRWRNT